MTVPCTAVEALAVNVELSAVLDAERAQLVADVFAGFGTRQIPAPDPGERRNCLALLELWNCWPAMAAVWADYKDHRTASAAATSAAVAGDLERAERYRQAAALITPLAPLDALAVTSGMLDQLGGIRDELADRARCAGVSEGRIDRILRGPRRP
ncbi:hypothetical protein EBN03_29415 [Nocardia stercoris]|uniref:Uncharacterized protein n=1 Tax=Nocardia stercoris TaxID=2483361 RepID=A0A3M2KSX2_9NOCA|nr:hypothetical protein EBN03_29415 [Nocardia stercoris]